MSVITLEQAKLYMRMDADYTLEDDLIRDMIMTAEQWCEAYTGLSFSVKELTKFISNTRNELVGPVISVKSVTGMGGSFVQFLYSGDVIHLNPGSSGIVAYSTGYNADKLPDPLKSAIKMMVATLYEHRESYVIGDKGQTLVEMPMGITDLLKPYSRSGGLFL